MSDKHYHSCEYSHKSKTCEGKLRCKSCGGREAEITDTHICKECGGSGYECENMKVNGECLSPHLSGICNSWECKFLQKCDDYAEQLRNSSNDIAKLKDINNHFRLLCMMPSDISSRLDAANKRGKIDEFVEVLPSQMDFSGIDSIIRRQIDTFENIGVDNVLAFIQFKQRQLEAYTSWVNEKLNGMMVSFEVGKRKKKETQAALEKEQQRKSDEERSRVTTKPKTQREKVIAGFVKMFRATMSEADAIAKATQMVESMEKK